MAFKLSFLLERQAKQSFNLGILYGLQTDSGSDLSVVASAPSRSELSNRQRLEISVGKRSDTLKATRTGSIIDLESTSDTFFKLGWISESHKKWSALVDFGYSSANYKPSSFTQNSKGLFTLAVGASRLLTSRLSFSSGLRLDQQHFIDVQTISNAASVQIVRATLAQLFFGLDATFFEAMSGRLKWEGKAALVYSLEKDKSLLTIDAGPGFHFKTGPWWWWKKKTGIGLTYQYEMQTYNTKGIRESIEQQRSRSGFALTLARVF